MRRERGITLIALIITIIVMLILLGVTINVSLNGDLLGKAKEAARRTEEQSIYEKISASVFLKDNGKIKVKETYEAAKRVIEEEGKTLRLILPTTEDKITEGTTGIVFEVEGKNGAYTYTITTERIIIGKYNLGNDFDIDVELIYMASINEVKLTLKPKILASMFKKEEAIKIVAEQALNVQNVETLQQLNLEGYNKINNTQITDYNEMKKKIGMENAGDDEIFSVLAENLGAEPNSDVTEVAATVYKAKSIKIKINNIEITEGLTFHEYGNKVSYNLVRNGTYNIEMTLDDRIGTVITDNITDISNLGKYVKFDDGYDSNNNKKTDDELYMVFYDEEELGVGEGAQIILNDPILGPNIGYLDDTIQENVSIEDINKDGDLELEKALYSYNNMVVTLNNYCADTIKNKDGVARYENGNYKIRSVGSDPLNPNIDTNIMFEKTSIPNYDVNTDDWFNIYDKKGKIGSNEDSKDFERIKQLGIWLNRTNVLTMAFRKVDAEEGGVIFSIARCSEVVE